jgi:hypothetical protein
MNESIDPMGAIEFLDKEALVHKFVFKHIEALREGVGSGDVGLLGPAFHAMYQEFLDFPDYKFLAMELMMMLAANTEGPLKVGVGEVL